MNRRDFLLRGGASLGLARLGAAGIAFTARPVIAGPFTREDFDRLVPADKRLTPEFIASLSARGTPQTYRWPESRLIGMPIGGLCCGQLYLGGDGRLWHWDLFNQRIATNDAHYAKPPAPHFPVRQGFALRVEGAGGNEIRPLDHTGWASVEFTGQYPIGRVDYRDERCPVQTSLEAFSPFIPLNEAESALPATLLRFTVRNTGTAPVTATLAGWLGNAVGLHSAATLDGRRRNRITAQRQFSALVCRAEPAPLPPRGSTRPDIAFEDFESERYEGWTATGTAFGSGPVEQARMPAYQGAVGAHGRRLVNSHNTRQGEEVGAGDAHTGTLTSRVFRIERDYIHFLIGGGAHAGRTCLQLRVDGQTVLSATGRNANLLASQSWDVRRWSGRDATLQILDLESGAWGNIGLDAIVFSDQPRAASEPLSQQPDFGSMTLALLGRTPNDTGVPALPGAAPEPGTIPAHLFDPPTALRSDATEPAPWDTPLTGALSRRIHLDPGQSESVTFAVTWHFPNLKIAGLSGAQGREYATRFSDALDVARYLARHEPRLTAQTRLWKETWYDASLPHWFLDRTFLNTSILASSTCYWMSNRRFYAWEGVGCCEGTCGHVWQYAHAAARLFPAFERNLREVVDYGVAFDPATGRIRFRAEHNDHWAADAQAGSVLRAYREHQMSTDSRFLKRLWPRVRKSLQFLMDRDPERQGILTGPQHNTLDADWYGEVAWLSGLYLAAVGAGRAMATEMGDSEFASRCGPLLDRGARQIPARLFDGEYFINRVDPAHPDSINSGTGCEIDQVIGQSWAFQVALGRILPLSEVRKALQSLWRYNFSPDVGPYRAANRPGRWYAMAGEAGLLMCTFPRTDWDYARAAGKGPDWAAGYFNECMNGFEYQVAGHMLWEHMHLEGLAITRAVHDRYHASRRNPWNEVECGDHYARSMASYGVYLAACGFEYHGPNGHLGFAPRLHPNHFKAAFTTAAGWGTFEQEITHASHVARLHLKWGTLTLRSLALQRSSETNAAKVHSRKLRSHNAEKAGRSVASLQATLTDKDGQILVTWSRPITLRAGETLEVVLGDS